MSTKNSDVVVHVIGKDELSDVIRAVEGKMERMTDAVEDLGQANTKTGASTIALGTALGNMAERALSAAVAKTRELASKGLELASTFEQQETTLKVLTGDLKTAQEYLEKWNQQSLKTPFTPRDWKEAGVQLKAYRFELEDISGWLETAGNAASAFDGTNLSDMVNVLGRLRAGGFGEAFERLREMGVAARDELEGKGLVFDGQGSYQGSVEQALEAVQQIVKEKYGNMMAEQAGTFKGMASTLQGYFDDFMAALYKSGAFDIIKEQMAAAIDYISKAIESGEFKQWAENVGKVLADIVQGLIDMGKFLYENRDLLISIAKVAAAAWAAGKLGGLITSLNTATSAAGGLKKAMVGALKNPMVWAAALAAAIEGINKLFKTANDELGKLHKSRLQLMSVEQRNEETIQRVRAAYMEMGKDWGGIVEKLKGMGKLEGNMERITGINELAKADKNLAKALQEVRDWRLKNSDVMKKSMAAAEEAAKKTKDNTKTTHDNTTSVVDNANAIKSADEIMAKFAGQTVEHLEKQLQEAKKALDAMRESGLYSVGAIEQQEKAVDDLVESLTGLSEKDLENAISYTPEDIDLPIDDITTSFEDLGDEAGDTFGGIEDWFKDNAGSFQDIGSELYNWSDGIANFVSWLGIAGDDVQGLAMGISQMGGGLSTLGEGIETGNSEMIFGGATDIGHGLGAAFGSGEEDWNNDTGQLISGTTDVGVGAARIASGDIIGGAMQVISGLPSMFDGLFESFYEGFMSDMRSFGFDDEWSEELMDKMEEDADRLGSKEAGIKANLEDFFVETDINSEEEYTRMGDWLNEAIDEYRASGHTAEEAYEKFGDELAQMKEAQDRYGYETSDAMEKMLHEQRTQTKEGRLGVYGEITGALDSMLENMTKYDFSADSYEGIFGTLTRTFRLMKSQGYSMEEIFKTMEPVYDRAKEAAKQAGVSSESLADFGEYMQRMKGASGLLDIVTNLEQAVAGMSDLGVLNQDMLSSMSTTATETLDKLRAQGFSPEEIAAQMGPMAIEMMEAAEKFNLDIPDDLKKIAEQAEEMGFGPEKSPAEAIEEANDKFLKAFEEFGTDLLFNLENLGEHADGGAINAPDGKKVLAWVHGGELVVPTGQGVPVDVPPPVQYVQPLQLQGNVGTMGTEPQEIKIKIERNKDPRGLDDLTDLMAVKLEDGAKDKRFKFKLEE